MFRSLIFSLIPVLVFGCCAPSKWEGVHFGTYGYKPLSGEGYHLQIVGPAHFKGSMYVYNQTLTSQDGSSFKQMVYQDFGKHIQYVVRGGKYNNMNVTTPAYACIPQDAKIIEHSHIGAGSSMIKTTLYNYMAMNSNVFMTVADEGCIPVMYESTGTTSDGTSFAMTLEFFGITPGIADMSVFNLPSSCLHV